MPVAIVTDSSACLPRELAEERGIAVVPLQVVIGATSYDEGPDGASPDMVAAALKEWTPVSTSRPGPAVFAEAYARAAAQGATEVVSVHLSGQMSGTVESAQLAARDAPVRVIIVDTRQVGIGTGFAALAAADVLDAGGTAEEAAAAARARSDATSSLFYVDTLEYLRRGGRIGAAAALLGGALAVKPLLRLVDGRVASLERVRTSARALARLEELAVEAAQDGAGGGPGSATVSAGGESVGEPGGGADGRGDLGVDVGVAHLANPDRAAQLAERLRDRLGDRLGDRDVHCGEVGAALGAHVGPGMIAVCISPRV
jgi:DegV family protein with EDD domain